ncbi:MAG: helix-turn-helix domain-containing protein [Melioribacteraceae bacterium]|nr:helix-turn-helix domain-containing protein [Melioribacteraceae bacterium]
MSITYKGYKISSLSYSINQAAKLLKLDRDYIRKAIESGQILTFIPPGRIHRRIPVHSLIDFMTTNSINLSQINEVHHD